MSLIDRIKNALKGQPEEPNTESIESVQVNTDGYRHAYDVPAFWPDGKGGYRQGIAQVYVAEESTPAMLGRLVDEYYRS